MLDKAIAFLKRDFFIDLSYRLNFIMNIFNMVLRIAVFYFLSKFVGQAAVPHIDMYGGDYFSFVLLGVILSDFFSVLSNAFSDPIREAQQEGNLEALAVTQTPFTINIFLSGLYPVIYTLFQIIVYSLVSIGIFGLSISNINIIGVLITLFLSILAFGGLGLFSAGFVLLFKRGNPVNWVLNSLSWLLAGTLYPVSVLPVWLQKVALLLPLTHALRAFRMSFMKGASLYELQFPFLVLFIFSFCILPIAFFFFRFALKRVREDGGLGHY